MSLADRAFTHPDIGRQARVELDGREVRLVFVCTDEDRAENLAHTILRQMRNGSLNITLMGVPTSIEED